jgi:hypothetical protein
MTSHVLSAPPHPELVWVAATDAQRRGALRTAFAPDTLIPDEFVADLRATGRRNPVAASRAIHSYLAEAPLRQEHKRRPNGTRPRNQENDADEGGSDL